MGDILNSEFKEYWSKIPEGDIVAFLNIDGKTGALYKNENTVRLEEHESVDARTAHPSLSGIKTLEELIVYSEEHRESGDPVSVISNLEFGEKYPLTQEAFSTKTYVPEIGKLHY